MNTDDTKDSVYTVAFKDNKFLMVWNPKRCGWEMPGGHIKRDETPVEGAVREYTEEAGYSIEIIAIRNLGHCYVCSARLGENLDKNHEMDAELFDMLPTDLSFDRTEYEDTVPWAASTLAEYRRRPRRFYIYPYNGEFQPRRL